MNRIIYTSLCFFIAIGLLSCGKGTIANEHVSFEKNEWKWDNAPKFAFEIKDTTKKYNMWFNLRHTGDYAYNNLYVKIYTTQPASSKIDSQSLQFPMALPDGEWIGKSGTGSIYSYRAAIQEGIKFPKVGAYTIKIAQDMRDNPLANIEDVGVEVEEAK